MRPPRSPRPASPLRWDLRRVFAEGVAWSVMVGIGETYFPAFALALGMGEVGAGLIATLPLLAGGLLQLATPHGVSRLHSRRRWATACASTQALTFLPLIAAAFLGDFPAVLVLALAGVYWGAGMAAGPAWNAWMDQLVPARLRAGFFSKRSRATQIGVLGGLLLGGAILDHAARAGRPLLGFASIFALGALARVASARFLSLQSEPDPPTGGERILTFRELLHRVRRGPEGHLLLYLASMAAGVALASPFFTPYLLERLDFSYSQYMVLIGTSFAAKGLALSFLDRLVRRFGAMRILRASAIGIVVIPFLWIWATSFQALFVLQILGGAMWAAHELAAFLLFFDTIAPRERTSLLTAFNLANAAATVGGSLLGGLVLARVGPEVWGYVAVFAISGGARLVALAGLWRLRVPHEPNLRVIFRFVAVSPTAGAVLRPILATIERWRDPEAISSLRLRGLRSRKSAGRARGNSRPS